MNPGVSGEVAAWLWTKCGN